MNEKVKLLLEKIVDFVTLESEDFEDYDLIWDNQKELQKLTLIGASEKIEINIQEKS
jgi:hypothetical protein